MRGWLRLHRCLVSKAIWKSSSPQQKTILISILIMANHKAYQWIWKGEKFSVEPGQFISSLASIKELAGKGVSTQHVRTALVLFEKAGFLTNESTKGGRLITIKNWGAYQGIDDKANKAANKQLTNSQQTANKQLTPNNNERRKEGKNERIEERIIEGKPSIVPEGSGTASVKATPPCPHQAIIEIYHEELPSLAGVTKWPEHLQKILRARWREDKSRQSLSWWRDFFSFVSKSDFLTGRKTDFQADLEWIVRPTNFTKIANGRYHREKSSTTYSHKTAQNIETLKGWLEKKRRAGNEK
jgi:hypothetical protein